jgi:MSHA biogenesis protein MshI
LNFFSLSAPRALRWPWSRQRGNASLVLSWFEGTLAYLLLEPNISGAKKLLSCGVVHQGQDSLQEFVRRLQGLKLSGLSAQIMLRPGQYQMLEIDRPAVADNELRQAVRYQLRDSLQTLTSGVALYVAQDITLDLMPVGDGTQLGQSRLFVVAAANVLLRELLVLTDAMQWAVSVIDIQETAQRNLQFVLANRNLRVDQDPLDEQSQASLLIIDGQAAVLTISSGQALLYTRRIELPNGFLADQWHMDGQLNKSFTDSPRAATEGLTKASSSVQDYRGQQHTSAKSGLGLFDPQAPDGRELVLQLQRSLDLWERSRTGRRLSSLLVFAGSYSQPCATWLSGRLERRVLPIDMSGLLSDFELGAHPYDDANALALCLPLFGALLRQISPP